MRVVFVDPSGRFGTLDEERLDATTERHVIALPPPSLESGDPLAALAQDESLGLVVVLAGGCPTRSERTLLQRGLAMGRRVWLHWPEEGAVEVATEERLASYWRHWFVINLYQHVVEPALQLIRLPMRVSMAMRGIPARQLPRWWARRLRSVLKPHASHPAAGDGSNSPAAAAPPPMVRHAQRLATLRKARLAAKAVPFPSFNPLPDADHRIPGCGVYLRTDFWAPIVSGGSYGHTCYVAKELAAVTDTFVCFVANRFPLIDEYGIEQVVMPLPSTTSSEDDIAAATPFYLSILREEFARRRPAYIYERLCLGNSAAAQLSAEFNVPYIVEYNGSEISMRRSFENAGYVYEAEYLEVEALAFEQATLISVVSAEIRQTLVARGIDPAKILVNPNGVDLDAYAPPSPAQRDALRAELGFSQADRVIGFTGTFGGWHGIDVLSEAIPKICKDDSRARFLLVGDGVFKHLVTNAITSFGLSNRVVDAGRVPQVEGARLMKACDIYVSPHSAHMVDSKFFGSPTKVFEYMALSGGIVASDLEQIGQVLSPSLNPDEALRGVTVHDERAVLCEPGNVGEFVKGVTALVRHPEMCGMLGRNARRAAGAHYSWTRHVANLWEFLASDRSAPDLSPDLHRERTAPTSQPPKSDKPAGSRYVAEAAAHPQEWFLAAERHRYTEYAPWMPAMMEFDAHAGEEVLEIGAGMGTDLAQFAAHGARVTDVDLSGADLTLAKENFVVRGLQGRFIQHDAETLGFDDHSFDLVYASGVLSHTFNTNRIVAEMFRVLKPGGRVIASVYAEDSLFYWRNVVWNIGLREGQLPRYSTAELMARSVERSRTLVKVYTRARLAALFERFGIVTISQRHIEPKATPRVLRGLSPQALGRMMGSNLIVKATKSR